MNRHEATWWVTAIALAVALAVHFSLIVLSILPLNPLSYRCDRAVTAYVDPLFFQRWSLFAPDPIDADNTVFARAYYHDGARELITPWVDLTDPVLERVRALPVTPLNLTVTVLSKATASIFTETGIVGANSAARDAMLKRWEDPAQQPRGLVVLEAAGAAALRGTYPELKFERVQIMISTRMVAPFTKRFDPHAAGEPQYLTLDAAPFPNVIPWFSANPPR
jgi:hypothetical protein